MSNETKLPSGWDKKLVRNICILGRGRVISENEINEHPGQYPVYSSQSINNGEMGRIDTYDFDGEYVTWTTDGAYAGSVFYRYGKFNCTNVCGTLKLKEEQYSHRFLTYLLSIQAKRYVSYVGNPKLMNGIMAEIELNVPLSAKEQSKIAEILLTCDEAIEKTDAKIEKLKCIKQGLMQDLFRYGIDEKGQIRTEKTHKFKDSPLGKIPLEWDVLRLGEKCVKGNGSIQTGPFGSQLHAEDYQEEGIPIITVEHLEENKILHQNLPLVGKKDYQRLKKYTLHEGDLVFSRVGAIDRCAYVSDSEEGWLFSGRCLRVRPGKLFHSKYLADLLNYHDARTWIANNAVGSTMKCLNTQILSDLIIATPRSIDEQSGIANVLSAATYNIDKEEQQKQKLIALKRGLMDDLLSGKVRVNKLMKEAV